MGVEMLEMDFFLINKQAEILLKRGNKRNISPPSLNSRVKVGLLITNKNRVQRSSNLGKRVSKVVCFSINPIKTKRNKRNTEKFGFKAHVINLPIPTFHTTIQSIHTNLWIWSTRLITQ